MKKSHVHKFTITGVWWWNFKIPKTCKYRHWEPVFGKKHTASKRLVNSYLDVFGGRWTKKHLRKEKHVLWRWLGSGFKFQIFLSFTSTYGNDPIWLSHIFQMDHWTLLPAIGPPKSASQGHGTGTGRTDGRTATSSRCFHIQCFDQCMCAMTDATGTVLPLMVQKSC